MLFHRKRWLGKNPNRPHIFRRSFTLVHDDLHCYSKRICTLCVKIDFLNSLLTSISLRSKPTQEKLNSYPPKICSLLDYTQYVNQGASNRLPIPQILNFGNYKDQVLYQVFLLTFNCVYQLPLKICKIEAALESVGSSTGHLNETPQCTCQSTPLRCLLEKVNL